MKRLATALSSLLWLSCSAPEDAHDEQRCAADLTCPDALVCYRGFCVEADDQHPVSSQTAPQVFVEDSGSVPLAAAPPGAAPALAADSGVGAPLAVAAAAAGSSPAEDAGAAPPPGSPHADPAKPADAGPGPGAPWWDGSPWNPADGAGPLGPGVVVSNGGPASPSVTDAAASAPSMPTSDGAVVCLALCSGAAKGGKDCKRCVTDLVGGDPSKVCRDAERGQGTPAVSALCSTLCGVDTEDVLGCHDVKPCKGNSCANGDG